MRDYPLTLYTLSFPPCPPHKHIRVCGDPGRGNDKEVRANARRHIAPDCHSRTPTFSTLIVLLRNDKGVTGHRNKKSPVGRCFISGADDRIISLCFITLQNCACAQPAYFRPPFCGGSNGSFAGSHPHPYTEIKNRPLGDVLFLGRMTGHLRWTILVQLRIVRDCALTTR